MPATQLPAVVTRTNVPTPPANATTTTLQVGTYNAVTDVFTLVLDLNDASSFYLKPGTLKLAQPTKTDVRSFNVRTPGERIVKIQYKNRTVSFSFSIRGATPSAISTNVRNFLAAVESPPYVLRVALPGASVYSFFDVKKAVHDVPGDPILWNAKALTNCTMAFECAPSIRGDRLTAQNLVTNPGFEGWAGGASYTQNSMPLAFSDPFANVNAYATVSGGAMTLSPSNTWTDIVFAQCGANLQRFYRLGETSGTTAYDIAGTAQHGTTHGSPTLGTTGLVSGDSDKAMTFASASSQYISTPATGLPTGNGAVSFGALVQIAANPAANATIATLGDSSTQHHALDLFVNSSGKPVVDIGGGGTSIVAASAITTGAMHFIGCSWDGTTLTLWVDGVSAGTATPGAQAIPASPTFNIAASSAPSAYWNGIADEVILTSNALGSSAWSALYAAAHTGATGTVANAATVPASGISSFGSPVWGGTNGIEQWQCRFRWVTSLTAVFYFHRVDASNDMKCFVQGTSLTLYQQVAATNHQLAQQTGLSLTHEGWYWIQLTQFPTVSGSPPFLQATLSYDDNGAVGAQIAQISANAFDAVTAQAGVMMLANSGAALVVGGLSSGAGNQVQLFGPGGWTFVPQVSPATGQASGAWDQTASNTYPNGPWTSFGAARIDCPPAGTVDARWSSNGVALGQTGIPVRTAGDTLSFSAYYKTTAGISNTCTVSLFTQEYDINGNNLSRSTTVASALGAQTAWSPLSGTLVTGGSTAYVILHLRVQETTAGGSANQQVWFDNVTVWNQTQCNQSSMPYAEMRYTGSPAQVNVSGIQGDTAAPAIVAAGAWNSINAADNVVLMLARRQTATANAQLAGLSALPSYGGTSPFVLDPKSLGGWYTHSNGLLYNSLPVLLAQDYQGVYHLFWRFQSAQSAGNLPNVTVYVQDQEVAGGTGGPTYNAPSVVPLSASSTWTLVDTGQVSIPLNPDVGLRDGSQIKEVLNLASNDTSGGGAAAQSGNWYALVPIDGSILILKAFNISPLIFKGGAGGGWTWIYAIGGFAWSTVSSQSMGWNFGTWLQSLSAFLGAQPDLTRYIGGIGSSSADGITTSADPYLTLDPTVSVGTTSGINQLVGLFVDALGTQGAMPLHSELYYWPQYLYPR